MDRLPKIGRCKVWEKVKEPSPVPVSRADEARAGDPFKGRAASSNSSTVHIGGLSPLLNPSWPRAGLTQCPSSGVEAHP